MSVFSSCFALLSFTFAWICGMMHTVCNAGAKMVYGALKISGAFCQTWGMVVWSCTTQTLRASVHLSEHCFFEAIFLLLCCLLAVCCCSFAAYDVVTLTVAVWKMAQLNWHATANRAASPSTAANCAAANDVCDNKAASAKSPSSPTPPSPRSSLATVLPSDCDAVVHITRASSLSCGKSGKNGKQLLLAPDGCVADSVGVFSCMSAEVSSGSIPFVEDSCASSITASDTASARKSTCSSCDSASSVDGSSCASWGDMDSRVVLVAARRGCIALLRVGASGMVDASEHVVRLAPVPPCAVRGDRGLYSVRCIDGRTVFTLLDHICCSAGAGSNHLPVSSTQHITAITDVW